MGVLKPWTNIRIHNEERKFAVSVWGRTYTFDDSLFPTSIVSKGIELLYEPIRLNMMFAGEKDSIYSCRHDVLEEGEEKVVVLSSGLCGNIALSTTTTIEYDGFMSIALRLIPCGVFDMITDRKTEKNLTPILDYMELSIKFNKETAGLFHFWPNTDSSVQVRDVINSGAFFETEMPYKPCIWVGNENVGINVCMETDESIQIKDKSQCIINEMHDYYNQTRIVLLDSVPDKWAGREEMWLAPLEPISYEFMFHATPVKPISSEAENNSRIYQTMLASMDVDLAHEYGAKWVILHEDWSLIQNYWRAADEEKVKSIIEKCHEYGMKVMLYFGYEYSSAMTEWEKNKDYYLNKDAKGRVTGGWTRKNTYQKAFIACYKGGYSAEMIESVARAMDKYGADGIYTDGTYVPWECANEAHGCGYRDEQGNLHVNYPIKAVREHVKKMYAEVHKRGGIIDTHQSACCLMPTLAFCDSYYDGENIQGNLSKHLEEHLNLEAFRCEYAGRNFGISANFLAYLNPPSYDVRNVLSLSLIHQIELRPGNCSMLKEVSKVWQAYDRFGVSTAERKFYWEGNSSVKCENNNVYISSYEKAGQVLAAISKFGDSTGDEKIFVPVGSKTAHEIFEDVYYDIEADYFTAKIEPATSYLFEIE